MHPVFDVRSHIYMLPMLYIGSDEVSRKTILLYDLHNRCFFSSLINVVPAIENIFLEVFTNASNHIHVSRNHGVDPGNIDILMDDKIISITNYGSPLTTEKYNTYKDDIHLPELIFGKFVRSNKNDYNGDMVSNKIGVKVVGVFSTDFSVVIHNSKEKKKYTQQWKNNMIEVNRPVITHYEGEVSSVQVIYSLDFEKFHCQNGYDSVYMLLFSRYAAETALRLGITVTFNGIVLNSNTIDCRDHDFVLYKKLHRTISREPVVALREGIKIVHNILLRNFLESEVFQSMICEQIGPSDLSPILYQYSRSLII
jgi:DNA gyrase/topoisomerase IV subunit B